ncbi:branched-chain amino acid ABC transporter permease [Neopusillimonas maritima]|jgi:urea transport system permease protein|uniref:Branched-chain amino acid ABC transporter permease n=1 Tax=Neopusillimonas maritima TaxID=2026239 RepID=A0A3A1YWF6_9BURK|nr:branched-chain amino acid ABC transporter permease [Neopusillimonas maritima]RIY41518.1 branched-chain amino acid ABC transporter permease [Neopusillimonas maritima]|tara:strand:- start:93880 stop:94902 length:1023 start_codon:yes stop_codon:yes gene_type:complete
MNKQGFLGVNLTVLVWVLLFLAPLALDEWTVSQFGQYLTYGILAMSLAFIWGQVGILCFGQAIFFGLGAYLMALTTLEKFTWFGGSQIMGLLLATVGPAIAAYILGKLLFVGRGLSGAFFAIVTLCAAVVVEIVAQRIEFIGGFDGLLGVPPLFAGWRDGDMMTTNEMFYVVLISALLIYLVALFVQRSPLGAVLAGIRNNEVRTASFGYKTTDFKVLAFTFSGAMAGYAGALFTAQFGFVSPAVIGMALSTEVLIWVAVGGRGVLMAAFLGVILVRWVESLLSSALGAYWLLTLGVLFIITVVVMPEGIFGRVFKLPLPRKWRNPLRGGDRSITRNVNA